jgi:hypothetical protein
VGSILAAAVLAGCGGGDAAPRPSPTATATAQRDSGAVGVAPRPSHARLLVRMTRVQGDDPLPFAIELRADRTAAVRYGGGHGGFEDKAIRLSAAEQARVRRALRGAPWRRVDGHTVEPHGFAGDDNGNRYALFHGRWSTTLEDGRIPGRMERLIRLLNAVIDGDLGRQVYAKRHSPIPVTPASPGG